MTMPRIRLFYSLSARTDTFFDEINPSDILSVSIRRGRQDETQQVEPSSAVIELRPNYWSWGPPNPFNYPDLPIQIRADIDGTQFSLFTGFVQRVEKRKSAGDARLIWQAFDALSYLSNKQITTARPQERAGERVAALVSEVNNPTGNPNYYFPSALIDPGETLVAAADLSGTFVQLVREMEVVEGGRFFVGANGAAIFKGRESLHRAVFQAVTGQGLKLSDEPAAGFVACIREATLEAGDKMFFTAVGANVGNGVMYGRAEWWAGPPPPSGRPRSLSLGNAPFATFFDAFNILNGIAAGFFLIWARPGQLVIEPEALGWAQALGIGLGTAIRVRVQGEEMVALVESIAWDFRPGEARLELGLSPGYRWTWYAVVDYTTVDDGNMFPPPYYYPTSAPYPARVGW